MSAKPMKDANITCRHERSHSRRLAVVAVGPGRKAVGRAVPVLDMGCRAEDMGFHLEAAAEVDASIAASHMRLVPATDIPHSEVAVEDNRRVAGQMAPVLARDLVRQRLDVTQEAC